MQRIIYISCFLLILIVGLRLPVLHFWNKYLTGDDAALYMETAINYSEDKDYSASVLRHIKNEDDLKRYIRVNGVRDRMEWIPPLYIVLLSLVYRITGPGSFMNGINIFNLFLFCLFLIIYLRFLIREFHDKQPVVLLSVLIMGLNFIVFEFTFGAHMESLYLLTFLMVLLVHKSIFESEKAPSVKYLLYPLALTLFLFSKYSSIPFVAAFLFHFLLKRRLKDFIVISLVVLLISSPWLFVRSYMISGHPLSQMLRGDFPFTMTESYSGFANGSIYALYSFIREIVRVFIHYTSIDYFFFLFPFAIVFISDARNKSIMREISIILILVAFTFFALIFRNANGRYQILLLVPVIPFAIDKMSEYFNSIQNIKARYFAAGILIVIFSTIQVMKITGFYNSVRKTGEYREKVIEGSLDLINQSGMPQNSTILVNVEGLNVYSDRNIVMAPDKLDEKNRGELFEMYNIDYVLFAGGERLLNRNIFRDMQVADSTRTGYGIYLYKVSR